MPKHDFLTPKAIANRQKSIGLQKLRWYCQMCQKQVFTFIIHKFYLFMTILLFTISVEMKTDSNVILPGFSSVLLLILRLIAVLNSYL